MKRSKGKVVMMLIGLAVVIGGTVAVKNWLARINQQDMEIAAFSKIQDPIARAAAYETDPAAAVRRTKQEPNDIAPRLALVHVDTRKGDLKGATHQLEQIVRIEPKKREYQYLLCGYLLKLGKTREATHRLENLTLKDDAPGKLARKQLDQLLASNKK